MTKEQRQNVKKWIAALRSGKYRRGTDALRQGNRFCCLGVACDVINPIGWKVGVSQQFWGSNELSAELDVDSQEYYGLSSKGGYFSNKHWPSFARKNINCLIDLNDSGYPFSKIADVIEYCLDHPETEMFV